MEVTTQHIDRLKEQVKKIDEAIEELRGSNQDTPNYEKMQRLQELAGEKEEEIKRLEYLGNMSYEKLNYTYHLLREMEELASNDEYRFIRDEIPEVLELIEKKTVEFDAEKARRFV